MIPAHPSPDSSYVLWTWRRMLRMTRRYRGGAVWFGRN